MTLSIYLAGPAVFAPDALARGAELKSLCGRYGFEGLFPLDNEIWGATPRETAAAIFHANIALIERADLVMADLSFFRGAEPDSGTCFEIGYAHAKGKRVFAHCLGVGDLRTRMRLMATGFVSAAGDADPAGWAIENFSLPVNLMLAISSTVVFGDAETCLQQIARSLAD